jgi:hypothetical protein
MEYQELSGVKWSMSAPRTRLPALTDGPDKNTSRSQPVAQQKSQALSTSTARSRSQTPEAEIVQIPKSAAQSRNQHVNTFVHPQMSSTFQSTINGSLLNSSMPNSSSANFLRVDHNMDLQVDRPRSPAAHAMKTAWSVQSSHRELPSRLRVVGSRDQFDQIPGSAETMQYNSSGQLQDCRTPVAWGELVSEACGHYHNVRSPLRNILNRFYDILDDNTKFRTLWCLLSFKRFGLHNVKISHNRHCYSF